MIEEQEQKLLAASERFTLDTGSATSNIRNVKSAKHRYSDDEMQIRSKAIIWKKYFEAFNFYFAKPINEILTGMLTSVAILLKDFQLYDEDREHLKRYYPKAEYDMKLSALSEYYFKENEVPRPNLSIHDQNKIISKRNLLLHRLYVSKLAAHKEMLPAAQGDGPLSKRKEEELLSLNEETEVGKGQRKLLGNGNAVGNDLMAGRDRGDERRSFESKLYDIYNPQDSSVFPLSKTSEKNCLEMEQEEKKKDLLQELGSISKDSTKQEPEKLEGSINVNCALEELGKANVKRDDLNESDFMMIQHLTTEEQSPASLTGVQHQEQLLNNEAKQARLSLKLEKFRETVPALVTKDFLGNQKDPDPRTDNRNGQEEKLELLSEMPLSLRNKDDILLPAQDNQLIQLKPGLSSSDQKALEQKQEIVVESSSANNKKDEILTPQSPKTRLRFKRIGSLNRQNGEDNQKISGECQDQNDHQNAISQEPTLIKPSSYPSGIRTAAKTGSLVSASGCMADEDGANSGYVDSSKTPQKTRFSLNLMRKTSKHGVENLEDVNKVDELKVISDHKHSKDDQASSDQKLRHEKHSKQISSKSHRDIQLDIAGEKEPSQRLAVPSHKLSWKPSPGSILHSPSSESLRVISNRSTQVGDQTKAKGATSIEKASQNSPTLPPYRYSNALLLSHTSSVGSIKSTKSSQLNLNSPPENSSKTRLNQFVFPVVESAQDFKQFNTNTRASFHNFPLEKTQSLKRENSAKSSDVYFYPSPSENQAFLPPAKPNLKEKSVTNTNVAKANKANLKLNLMQINQTQALPIKTQIKDSSKSHNDRISYPSVGLAHPTFVHSHLLSNEDEYFSNLSPQKPQSIKNKGYYRLKTFTNDSPTVYFGTESQKKLDLNTAEYSSISFRDLTNPYSARSNTDDNKNLQFYNFNRNSKQPKLIKQYSNSKK